ncbi:MAG TPA: ATP-binding cassette domain-containing protein [Gammaproteobacteria bacterium]|jgi:phospholipid/cholesterol/gamma-HCH transport system ATP-binding protein|nr:ATP-binding cassette domain-containing protein [Gammaproteobacteria bacterium]
MPTNIVEINQMSFQHDNGKVVFRDVDLLIPQGKVTAVMGPSGTGKTTLLKLIGGQLAPTCGTIRVGGELVHDLSRQALYKLRRRLGMLFQASGLFTHMTVFDNVAFPLREHTPLSESMIHTITLMKLQMVGLRGAKDLMPSELSGGMARRVALARAIALDPELIMYDEPFTGQDPISLGVLVKLVRTLNDALGLTSIIVSHDVQETLTIADYVYVIVDAKIIGQGTPEAIVNDTANKQLQQFIQGLADGPVPFHYPAASLEKDFLEEHV